MGHNSSCDHIEVWRRAVFLFRKISAEREGTFHKINIDRCVIEHPIGKKKGESPDIIGWSSKDAEKHYLMCEVTCNPALNEEKKEQLSVYSKTDPNVLRNIGIQSSESPIVILLTRNYLSNYTDYTQIILDKKLSVSGIEHIKWECLQQALQEDVGMDLINLPELSFTLLPELHYVRPCIVDSIMKMITPKIDFFTAEDIAKEAMESIYEDVDLSAKNEVIARIQKELNGLVKKEMKEYLKESNGLFSFTDKGKKARSNPQSRLKIESLLKTWSGIRQERIDEY